MKLYIDVQDAGYKTSGGFLVNRVVVKDAVCKGKEEDFVKDLHELLAKYSAR